MPNFIQVTPFMHVDDLERAVAFFTGILGFETRFRTSNYAYVRREMVGSHILEQKEADGAPPGNRRFAYYIDVRDVNELYDELRPKLETLPKGDVHGRWTRATANVSCWCSHRMETCSRLGKQLTLSERQKPKSRLMRVFFGRRRASMFWLMARGRAWAKPWPPGSWGAPNGQWLHRA